MEKIELTHHEGMGTSKDTIREAIFGLEDGIVSTLGAVVGIAVGTQNQYIVVLSGMVVIAVEAVSMAAGSYISSKTERDISLRWLKEEEWEIEHDREREVEELREWYTERGFNKKEVEMLLNRVTSDKKLWLEEMAHYELKIFPDDLEQPTRNAWIMGLAYIVGGIVPITSFFLLPIETAIWSAVGCSAVALFLVGAAITKLTYRNWLRSGLEMVTVAMGAAVVGFLIAQLAEFLLPLLH